MCIKPGAIHAAGWAPVGDGGFKISFPVDSGRTLAIFFTPYDLASFSLMAPIDKMVLVPADVRTRAFDPYQMEALDEMAVLSRHYPAGNPGLSAAALTADARALAAYTDRQFSGAPH